MGDSLKDYWSCLFTILLVTRLLALLPHDDQCTCRDIVLLPWSKRTCSR